MNYDEIVQLYREIACEFRAMGAEKVIMLKSRTNADTDKITTMEIALEGLLNKEEMQKRSQQKWPFLEMDITIIGEIMDQELFNEIYEDGVVL